MSIVSVPAGDFTPGARASLEFAAALINAAWDQANTKNTAFETKIGGVEGELPDISDTVAGIHLTADSVLPPTVAEPIVNIPATADVTDAMSLFDTKYLELVALLSDKFVAFRNTYFPDDSAAYGAAEDWLQAAVANPEAGLPPAVADQIWGDDRSRILADADRAGAEVLATFATKRFPLPPGAAASAVLQIQQNAQDATAESSRKVAIMSVDMQKFVIERLITIRQLAMGSAVDYIKALASGPEMASQLINVGYDAQSKLISAASSFYNARTEATKLTYTAGQQNADRALQAAEKNQATDLGLIEAKVKALLTEAQSLAQMATSMYNNLHASAGTSYGVNGT